jgi:NAD(P)-dependent dehydrogenase (short-subunit alcohol dehydrogenase family)
MTARFEGAVAVVTGGASGMGAELAWRLRKSGARPVVWDVAPGADVACDVSDARAVEGAMARTLELAGVPSFMAACAGIGDSGTLLELEPERWDRVLAVNLRGAWLSMRAVAGAMIAAGSGGSIVAVSSVSGTLVDRGMGAYCASKAGLDMLVRVAAFEWAPHRIRVNAVGPGVTATPMLSQAARLPGWLDGVVERTPLGRLGSAGDIADAILALLGIDWVTGQVLFADGGLSLVSPIDAFGAQRRASASPAESPGR